MKKYLRRLGVLPSFLIGAALFVLGSMAANHIVNNFWPFNVQRIDLVRDVALGQASAPSMLEAANTEIILAFLAALLTATTGLALPLAFYLNKRFGRRGQPMTEPPSFIVVLRQAMFAGIWVSFCVWLSMNRMLNPAVAGLVAIVLALFEMLLQIRTRTARIGANA